MQYSRDMSPAQRRAWQNYCLRRSCAFPDSDWYDYTFDLDDSRNRKICQARVFTENWRKDPYTAANICLWGVKGSGRHFFAGCIANELLDAGCEVLVLGFQKLLEELKDHEHRFTNRWQELTRYGLLVIDLCNADFRSGFAVSQLMRLLELCGHHGQRLLLISDVYLPELFPHDSLLQRRISAILHGFMQVNYTLTDYSLPGYRTELYSEYAAKQRSCG